MNKNDKQLNTLFKIADKAIAFHEKSVVWFNRAEKQYKCAISLVFSRNKIKKIWCKYLGLFCYKIGRIYSFLGKKYEKRYRQQKIKLGWDVSPIKVIESY